MSNSDTSIPQEDRRAHPRKPLRIAVIDDDRAPRIWVPMTISGTSENPGPIPDAVIETFARPLADPESYSQRFDGIVLDYLLGGNINGAKLATEIRAANWRRPVILLLTGLDPAALPFSFYESVHYMLSKDDLLKRSGRFMWELRRWAAHMAQVRDAYQMGYDAGKAAR